MAAYALTTSPVLPRPSLAELAASLRAKLTRRPSAQTALRATLLTAYRESLDVRPFSETHASDSPIGRAAFKVDRRLRVLLSSILEAPTPTTAEGLSVLALAAAIHAEGMARSHWDNGHELVATARALLVATGTALPAEFAGFGDEDWFEARDVALLAGPGRLPAWAQVEAADAA